MTTDTAELLERLRRLDIRLRLEGDRLTVNAPEGALTPALREELGRRRDEVKAHLAAQLRRTPPPLVRVPREANMPVSHTQQRLWFIKQMDPGSHVYNVVSALRLTGHVDVPALQRALASLIARHEALRTRFLSIEGTPRCAVEAHVEPALEVVELGHWPGPQRAQAALDRVVDFSRRPVDITRAPLLRCLLVHEDDQHHHLVFVIDHIIADGLSLGILLEDFAVLYAQHCGDPGIDLPELPLQYLDYAQWERLAFAQGVLEEHQAYWTKQLEGLPEMVTLPADRPRPAVRTSRGARSVVQLPPQLSTALKSLARSEGATLYMVLLSALQVLMHRHGGETDLPIGSVIANRGRAEVRRVIGFFANNIVLRGNLEGNPTVSELIGRNRDLALGAYANQDMPFDLLVDALSTQRALDHAPLFQVLFVLQNLRLTGFDLPGLRCEQIELPVDTARFDLSVDVFDLDLGLRVYFEYSTDLYDAATIDRLSGHFHRLLEAMVGDPSRRIRELPMLGESERAQVLLEWNRTQAPYEREQTVHGLFEAQVRLRPQAQALVFEGQSLSYGELNARANRLARHLRGLGVGPGALVGVWLERSTGMVEAVLGVLKAGAAYVPLDPAFPQDRIDYMMADAGLAAVVTQQRLAATLGPGAPRAVCLDRDAERLAAQPEQDLPPLGGAGDLAYVIYTSGSTGRPKGVMLEHRSVVNFLCSMQREPGIGPGDRFVSVTTLSFDIAGLELHGPLSCGGTVVLASRATALDGRALAGLLEAERASLLQATPSTWRLLLDSGWAGRSGLKMLCGGEALPRDLAERLLGCGGELWNMYGPTETTIWSTLWRVTDATRAIPIGRPIANTQCYVLDELGQPVPVGVGGELCIGGDGLARGYLGREELTAEKFVDIELPETGVRRVYRTGDVVRWRADGALEYVGRRDHQVKLRGYRIELGEIEAVLATHEGVKDNVVQVREDTPGDQRLVAYVVAAEGQVLQAEAMRATLRQRLPEYMVPNLFVTLEALPLTPNGKVDRKALPVPAQAAPQQEAGEEQPMTPLQARVAGLWGQVLQLGRVGLDDNFFGLGGHSLLLVRLQAVLQREFERELALVELFQAPTVRQMSELLERAEHGSAAPAAIERVPRDQPLPASHMQQRLWFLKQLDPTNASYNIPWAVRWQGKIDQAALADALASLSARHESLRMRFVPIDGVPHVVVESSVPTPIEVSSLQSVPPSEREATLQSALSGFTRRPFATHVAPLWRALLVRVSDDETVLCLVVDHLVVDGVSLGLLVEELRQLYVQGCSGTPALLHPLEYDYLDLVAAQRGRLSAEALERHSAFWKSELAGLPEALQLPTDRPRSAVQTFRGARRSSRWDRRTGQALRALAKQSGSTPFQVLLSAFQTLLHRYTGASDLAVGTAVANRIGAEAQHAVGYFANSVVLRADLSGRPSGRALLERSRAAFLRSMAHQEMPFEMLVDALVTRRSLDHPPLFQVLFVLQQWASERIDVPGATGEATPVESGTARFDLSLDVFEAEDQYLVHAEYNTDLFDAATIDRMLGHYRSLVEGLVAAPDTSIDALPMLSDAERAQVLLEWNRTQAPYEREQTVHGLFEAQARLRPQAQALVFEGQTLGYGELNARANRLAHHLRTLGVGSGALVGVWLERSTGMVEAVLGVLKAGAAYVPLDPAFPQDRIDYMMADAGLAVVVTQQRLAATLGPGSPRAVCLDRDAEQLAAQPAQDLPPLGGAGDLAYVIYTSGSTGRPKGVMLEHRSVVNFLCSMQREPGIGPGDRFVSVTTLSFDIAGLEIHGPLSCGGTVVLASRATALDGRALAALLEAERASLLQATPSTWRLLLDSGWAGRSGLKMLCGGEALPRDLAERLLGCGGELWNMYGPTETTIWSTLWRVTDATRAIPIGRPIANTQCYVLDERGQPAPVGVGGELCIGGDGLARGYLGREELTAEKFVDIELPETGVRRVYRTGDVVRWRADGALEYVGRRDHQVKLRGYRIELGEIEAVLATHEGVKDNVVQVREDTPGDQRLVAYVVAAPGQALQAEAMRATLRQRLPEYMVPNLFVTLEALPLTPNGKVDRKALPVPAQAAPQQEAGEEQPMTPLQARVAGLWGQVLQLGRVGLDDNFFGLGGHSLLLVRLQAVLQREFERELALVELFQAPTVRQMSEMLERAEHGSAAPAAIERVPRDQPLPASLMQERLWLFDQLEPGSTAYHIQAGWRLRGELDADALQRAVSALVQRHESLRTCFASDDGGLHLIVAPEAGSAVRFFVADDGPSNEQTALAALRAEATRPFDLGKGPLWRVTVCSQGRGLHWLALTLHHTVADGWATELLARELATLYAGCRAGRPAELPALPIQYADYAAWQRRRMAEGALAESLAYWRTQLAGAQPALDLPLDRPRPALQRFEGALSSRELGAGLRDDLQAVARSEGGTLFMVMLAAFNAVLARHAGQDDLCVGLPVAGRDRAELQGLVGVFINTVVLRTRLAPGMDFAALLRQVRDNFHEAYTHQDVPFDTLVAELGGGRDTSRTPLFQVMVNMQNFGGNEPVRFDGLDAEPIHPAELGVVQSKFDLTLYLRDEPEGLTLALVYNAALFDAARIDEMLSQYARFLGAVAQAPRTPMAEIPLVTDEAARRLPDPALPMRTRRLDPVHVRISEFARQAPHRPAAIDASAVLSAGELDARSNQLARHLAGAGIGRGDVVAILAERHVGLAWALLGVLKAGAAFMLLDPANPPQRTAQCLRLVRPRGWVRLDHGLTLPPAVSETLGELTFAARAAWGLDAAPGEASWRQCSDAALPCVVDADDLAYVAFTSGSTGEPKAIAGTHLPLAHFFEWHGRQWQIGPADRVSVLSGLGHDPLLRDVLGALWLGSTCCLPETARIGDPGYLGAWMARQGITVCHLTPSMAELIATREPGAAPPALPALRRVFFGGELLRAGTISTMRHMAPSAALVNYYGATETPQAMGWYEIPASLAADAPPTPLGRGIDDVQLLVLNEAGQLAAPGEIGEIHIRTPYLARGYLHDAAGTAHRFLAAPNAVDPRDRMYRTGDLGRYRIDGVVDFAGRRDGQVKLRGFRIETGEIEAALRRQPEVSDAAVVLQVEPGREDRLVAFIVRRDGASDGAPPDWRERLRPWLPDHMVPAVFVALERLPMTPNGKLDRRALPVPSAHSGQPRTMPSGPTEQAIAAIWAEVLGDADFGADDDFFALGGHSLMATRVLTRLRARLGVELPLRAVFEAPTVARLARVVDAAIAARAEGIIEREDISI